ncbi:unnamed protein product [Sphagnum troendelagicum]|uniref:Uncharacterized protein n=1 Tax=Sphagnum troendelagicum TaxID=128251 RepID=A0ABP0V3G1_9BRYO
MAPGASSPTKALGQRSIASMFSNSDRFAKAGGGGRAPRLPLMEFLARKLDKRSVSSIPRQKGCHSVVAQGAVHDHSSGTEFRPLIHHTEALTGQLPASKRQRREFVQSEISQASFARIGSVVGQGTSDQKTDLGCADRPKKEEIHLEPELDIFKADSSPFLLSEGGHLESQSNQDHQQSLRHPETCAQSVPANRMRLYKNLNQSTTGEAIGPDYTFYEIDEENLESQNRVGFSALDDVSEPLARCPVCNNLVPSQGLQAHVEAELDAMEDDNRDHSVHVPSVTCQFSDRENSRGEGSVQFNFQSGHSKSKSQHLLVLGDHPRPARHRRFQSKRERPGVVFNHYDDGGGWWNEGRVGVESEAVGSMGIWEGLGSMSFGSSF